MVWILEVLVNLLVFEVGVGKKNLLLYNDG